MPSLPVMLDVAIGMAFIFLTLSAICSAINEIIARITNRRGSYLGRGIKYLLWDTRDQPLLENAQDMEAGAEQAKNLIEYIFRNPLVRRLGTDFPKFPSYIPNSSFSLSLIEGIRNGIPEFERVRFLTGEVAELVNHATSDAQKLLQPVVDAVNDGKKNPDLAVLLDPAQTAALTKEQLDKLQSDPKVIAGLQEIRRVLENARLAVLSLDNAQVREGLNQFFSAIDVKDLRHNIDLLPDGYVNPKIKRTLLTLIDDSETGIQQLDQVKARLEGWFDDGMGRVSVLYKRWTQLILAIIGLILVVILNADALHIVSVLWNDPTLRAALVAEAQSTTRSGLQSVTGTPNPPSSNAGQDIQATQAQINVLLEQLNGLPFGWNCQEFNSLFRKGVTPQPIQSGQNISRSFPLCDQVNVIGPDGKPTLVELDGISVDGANVGLKVLGLLLMGLGAALGAPFWFDILDRLVTLRPDKPTTDSKT